MSLTIHAVADQLDISANDLWRQAIQAFLREQTREFLDFVRRRIAP